MSLYFSINLMSLSAFSSSLSEIGGLKLKNKVDRDIDYCSYYRFWVGKLKVNMKC